MADRVVLRDREIEALSADLGARDALLDVAEPRVRAAQAAAPKDTGAGAASIGADAVLVFGRWAVRAAWDREHYYMSFHELGTETLPARPFLVPAFEGATA